MKAFAKVPDFSRSVLMGALAAGLLSLTGCSTISKGIDAVNPFAKTTKMPALEPIKANSEVKARWTVNAGKAGKYVFVPAVTSDGIFVASQNGTISRINEGSSAWRVDAGQPLSAGVGSDGKIVVVGTPKGEVLAFAAADGKPLWKAQVSSEVLAAPAVGAEGVVVRSGDNRVSLLDAADGKRKWTYQRSTPALALRNTAMPVFAEKYVFVGFPGGKLVAMDMKNGAPTWEGTVALPKGTTELDRVADIVSMPAIEGGQACAVAFQGRVACFDLKQGGQLLWARDMSSAVGLAMDGRYIFVTDDKGAIHALERSTGASVWKQDKLAGRQVSGPVVKRGLVAVGDGQGMVHFLTREDGSFAARVKLDGTPVLAAPQAAGSGFLVQTTGGDVVSLEVQ